MWQQFGDVACVLYYYYLASIFQNVLAVPMEMAVCRVARTVKTTLATR